MEINFFIHHENSMHLTTEQKIIGEKILVQFHQSKKFISFKALMVACTFSW